MIAKLKIPRPTMEVRGGRAMSVFNALGWYLRLQALGEPFESPIFDEDSLR